MVLNQLLVTIFIDTMHKCYIHKSVHLPNLFKEASCCKRPQLDNMQKCTYHPIPPLNLSSCKRGQKDCKI